MSDKKKNFWTTYACVFSWHLKVPNLARINFMLIRDVLTEPLTCILRALDSSKSPGRLKKARSRRRWWWHPRTQPKLLLLGKIFTQVGPLSLKTAHISSVSVGPAKNIMIWVCVVALIKFQEHDLKSKCHSWEKFLPLARFALSNWHLTSTIRSR